jgi:hypothetical protein
MNMGIVMKSIPLFIISMFLMVGTTMAKDTVQVYGYVEKATLVDKNLTLSAKLDTGAKSASLHAINLREVTVNGVPYIHFTVPTKEKEYEFECEYIGKVKIKLRNTEASPSALSATAMKRPVVLLNVQLGDKVRAIQVNLTNRKRFIYPLLLGRDAIIDFNGAVDPAKAFTIKSKS